MGSLESLEPVLENHPEFVEAGIVERIVEPERLFISVFHGSTTMELPTQTEVSESNLTVQLVLTRVD